MLCKENIKFKFSSLFTYCDFADDYFNIPTFKFRNNVIANNVLTIFKKFIELYNKNNSYVFITLSFIVNYEGKALILNIAGKCNLINKLLKDVNLKFENNLVDNDKLLFAISKSICKEDESLNCKIIFDNRMFLKRNIVRPLNYGLSGKELIFTFDKSSAEQIKKSKIKKICYYKLEVECTKCKSSYLECDCNVHIDDTTVEVNKRRILGINLL